MLAKLVEAAEAGFVCSGRGGRYGQVVQRVELPAHSCVSVAGIGVGFLSAWYMHQCYSESMTDNTQKQESKEIGNLWVFHGLSLPGIHSGLIVTTEANSFARMANNSCHWIDQCGCC